MLKFNVTRRRFVVGASCIPLVVAARSWAAISEQIDPQPYFASIKRAVDALAKAGQPIATADADKLAQLQAKGGAEAVAAAEAILNAYTLARIVLDRQGMSSAVLAGAERTLIEQGWKSFLLRISNPGKITQALEVAVSGGAGMMSRSNNEQRPGVSDALTYVPAIEGLWLAAQIQGGQPLTGAAVEYRVIDLFSRDRGSRIGKLGFGAGRMDLDGLSYGRAMWAEWSRPLVFNAEALPTDDVTLAIRDSDGAGCMASLIITDGQSHVFPPQVLRLAPDMSFHAHIYRADGETVRLPDGEYMVTSWRGPEYLRQTQTVRIGGGNRKIVVKLNRWIEPSRWAWYSGDTHIHAAGCAHYMHPSEGVTPETIIRHVRGEALSIGDVLTWGPAWYHQKQFFSGHAISPAAGLEYRDLQAANNTSLKPEPTAKDGESLLRYDVEISQFPSSHSGHPVLLRLKEQNYPGTETIEDWPSWNLPILQWARQQGAMAGYGHCGSGMAVATTTLPNYEVPRFDAIGTNEAIVDVTHGVCDFLSGCEFEPSSELNAWYHLLNCGFRIAMVGETDYPCLSDDRPGAGRSYVQLNERPIDDAGYNAWIEGIRAGRLYFGDGRSHFLKVRANGRTLGETVELAGPAAITLTATVAARLEPSSMSETLANAVGWHLERSRIGDTRNVPVELIVNGYVKESAELLADGMPRELAFKAKIERSSWIALRILNSAHTHPIFVSMGGRPIRASQRSAQWLRMSVDALWLEKHRMIRNSERPAAADAYDHARRTYDRIIAESDVA